MAKQQGAVAQPAQAPQAVAPATPAASAPVAAAPVAPAQAAPVAVTPMTSADVEFSSLMSTFRIFVILSIVLDFFFIFTILSFVKKGELKAKAPYVSPQLQSEFSTWGKILIIGLVVRIVLAVGCTCLQIFGAFAFLPFADWSTYTTY